MKVPVLIPRIFDHPHTYLSGKFGKLKPGTIVQVPFGKNNEIGVIWDTEETTKRKFKLKTILEKQKYSLNENINGAPTNLIECKPESVQIRISCRVLNAPTILLPLLLLVPSAYRYYCQH